MKNRFKSLGYKFQAWMRGRYGLDELNTALAIVSLILLLLSHIPGPMHSSAFIPFRRSGRVQPSPPLYFYYENKRCRQAKTVPPISGCPSDSVVVLPQNGGDRRREPSPRACADSRQPRTDGWPHFMPAVLPQKAVHLVRRRDDAHEGCTEIRLFRFLGTKAKVHPLVLQAAFLYHCAPFRMRFQQRRYHRRLP